MERQPSKPMVNYAGDVENEDDYEIGWEWHEVNPGPFIAAYNGFRQCLLDPTTTKPEDFFNVLFDTRMYTIMAEETNKYAERKKQARENSELFTQCMYLLYLVSVYPHLVYNSLVK